MLVSLVVFSSLCFVVLCFALIARTAAPAASVLMIFGLWPVAGPSAALPDASRARKGCRKEMPGAQMRMPGQMRMG
ncbi:hypothetical protein [Herbaspirillum chlorophenolicum]|uniref:hypothetical protein n=1 Tax=Herbaspirillum chlorophenolicum TaxID=211589 RepID=UPI00067BF4C0|nr:hypothetical protein [Herbaspirillum chlorophenolicum]